jgi:hypothetical protein
MMSAHEQLTIEMSDRRGQGRWSVVEAFALSPGVERTRVAAVRLHRFVSFHCCRVVKSADVHEITEDLAASRVPDNPGTSKAARDYPA